MPAPGEPPPTLPVYTVLSVISQAAGWYMIWEAVNTHSVMIIDLGRALGMLFGGTILLGSMILAARGALGGEGHWGKAVLAISLLLPAGAIVWSQIPAREPWGAPGGIYSFSVARDNSILITGSAVARLHPDGTLDWEHPRAGFTSRIEALDNGQILVERDYKTEILDSRGRPASGYLANCPVLLEIALRPTKGLAMRCDAGVVVLDDGAGHQSVIRTQVEAAAEPPVDPSAREHGLAAHADGSFSLLSGNHLRRIGPDGKRRWQYQSSHEIYEAYYAEDGSTYFREGEVLVRIDARGERDRSFAPAEEIDGPMVVPLPAGMVLASKDLDHHHSDFDILRLMPNGSPDPAFTPIKTERATKAARHGDGLLILHGGKLSRFDAAGGPDKTFTVPTLTAYRP